MTTKEIQYRGSWKKVSSINWTELEKNDEDGIKHEWSACIDEYGQVVFRWEFDWEALKVQGVHRLVGHLVVKSVNVFVFRVCNIFESTIILRTLGGGYSEYLAFFEYNLTAHYSELRPPRNISYGDMFVASDKTDVILIVDEKKLNVNKTFLSFHSDYFSSLFSSNFKEGQMKEIEIKEVSYGDFGLLLSSFYPNPQFPNDHTVEKLLEMADRFQVLSVIGIVEYHLLHISKLGYEKILWLADKYGMQELLEKCISQMNSLEMAKKLEKSPEYEKLSDRTSSLIFRQLLKSL